MRPSIKILIIVTSAMLFFSTRSEAQSISLKTNALALGALTPNVGFEFVTGERTSMDISIMGHISPYGLPSSMLSLQPELRYWFNGRPMINEFIGVTAGATTYKMTMKDQVRDGMACTLGVTAGYVMALGRKWNIEFSGGCAVSYFSQRQYNHEDNGAYFIIIPEKHNSRGFKFLPIDLGISFTYIIK